ncbi:LysM peptidoglycan-binding domain-containing protein [Flavilitoribacter nigricans]|uniref:LysM domain-containing protein n=1 Tax=Flavilitoribacter nigricans (strain ATCC 23147 / DSM 23189 / NBRC 102662 / NCIMB 1420 / SS-2) TaxID=1122177 RepID=A0A2D0NGK7_FLAN2|nr:LysM peptidoglycan-binding domain-containing protein [Flavilitoribacter nigricans]PHN07520.1 hypothetical protein CRP01_05310 [Flavilitoribacter nigricans DSM 23189 = NBRC 102662]
MTWTGIKWSWIWLLMFYPDMEQAGDRSVPEMEAATSERSVLPESAFSAIRNNGRLDTVALQEYPFLNMAADTLINAAPLAPFFQKLKELERGERERLNIVHIGDSHIQADWWTGYLRIRLQELFGSAGRGLVFPYALAGTNSPTDLRSGSNQIWESRRSTFQQKHIPVGISGLTVQASGKQIWLDLQVRNDTIIDYAFNQIKLFSIAGEGALNWSIGHFSDTEAVAVAAPPKVYHTVRSGDTLYGLALRHGTSVRRLQQWNNLRGSMIKPGQKLIVGNGNSTASDYDKQLFEVQHMLKWESGTSRSQWATVELDSLTRRLLMRARRTDGNTGSTRLYGISLENRERNGLLYHAIGVNGVTYYHYNEAPEFWEQLPALEPDLIIVSLGTNETAISNFQPNGFSEQVEAFANRLQGLPASTSVLLTTPGDALRRRRYENPAIKVAGEIITEAAGWHNFAVWDLFDVMGGAGSIRQWRSAQLTGRDYLHFTKVGYELQGELLFKALMQAYGEY